MTALVMRWLGVLAGVLVTLAAHYGVHLDSAAVLVALTAVGSEAGHLVVLLAAHRWPAAIRTVEWISRQITPGA